MKDLTYYSILTLFASYVRKKLKKNHWNGMIMEFEQRKYQKENCDALYSTLIFPPHLSDWMIIGL